MERYETGPFLNAGIGGVVHAGSNRRTGKQVAIKTVVKSARTSAAIGREVACANSLRHPGIIKTEEIVHDKDSVHLVQEYAEGGDLFDHLRTYGCVSEEGVLKALFEQIVAAVAYLHHEGFCHRDLKPENVVLTASKDTGMPEAKLIDFGMAERSRRVQGRAGTDAYAAPEVVGIEPGQTVDGYAADVWSLGVILVALLCGRIPWTVASLNEDADYAAFVKRHKEGCRAAVFNASLDSLGLTSSLAQLLDSMLNPRPSLRPTADMVLEMLKHPWLISSVRFRDEFSSSRVPTESDSGCSWGDLAPEEEVDFSSLPLPDFEPLASEKPTPVKMDSGVSFC